MSETSSPPEKESAPSPAKDSRHPETTTDAAAVQPESPWLAATKNWLRMTRTERLEFLRDVRAGCPNIWRQAEAEFEKGARP